MCVWGGGVWLWPLCQMHSDNIMSFSPNCLHSVMLQHHHHHHTKLAEVLNIRSPKCTQKSPSTNKRNDRHTEWHYETSISYWPQHVHRTMRVSRSECVCVCMEMTLSVNTSTSDGLLPLPRAPAPILTLTQSMLCHPKTVTFISSDVSNCLSTFVVVCQLINSRNSIWHVLRQ